MILFVTPVPRSSVVFPFPALLNVAVSPVPGTGDVLQFPGSDHTVLVVPFQVALVAQASNTPVRRKVMQARAAASAGLSIRERRCLTYFMDGGCNQSD